MARQAALESKMAHVIDLLKRRREDSQLKDLQRSNTRHSSAIESEGLSRPSLGRAKIGDPMRIFLILD